MRKELALSQQYIENRIFTIRDQQIMFDRGLLEMYQVQVKRLNEQVNLIIELMRDDLSKFTKKWFGFSRMDSLCDEVLNKIKTTGK